MIGLSKAKAMARPNGWEVVSLGPNIYADLRFNEDKTLILRAVLYKDQERVEVWRCDDGMAKVQAGS